jgi:endo-1,4-beta-D-glucanase Y
VDLDLQLNGEDLISSTVASALYMRQIQFLENHTRLPNPNMAIYNYSWSLDPENYLPTGQVNFSRVQNQNLWMNLTPSTQQRYIRVYAKSYNILKIQYGLGGVLFMDNNFY